MVLHSTNEMTEYTISGGREGGRERERERGRGREGYLDKLFVSSALNTLAPNDTTQHHGLSISS